MLHGPEKLALMHFCLGFLLIPIASIDLTTAQAVEIVALQQSPRTLPIGRSKIKARQASKVAGQNFELKKSKEEKEGKMEEV